MIFLGASQASTSILHIVLFVKNLTLPDHLLYRLALALQVVFYVLALFGYISQKMGKAPRILGIPFPWACVFSTRTGGVEGKIDLPGT